MLVRKNVGNPQGCHKDEKKKSCNCANTLGANFISALGNAHKNCAMDTSAIHSSSARNSSIMLSSTSDIKVLLGEVLNKDWYFFGFFFPK